MSAGITSFKPAGQASAHHNPVAEGLCVTALARSVIPPHHAGHRDSRCLGLPLLRQFQQAIFKHDALPTPVKPTERSFARRIDLTSLQLFVAVCEAGSIGKAAEREFIAASANDVTPAFLDHVRPIVGPLPKIGCLKKVPARA